MAIKQGGVEMSSEICPIRAISLKAAGLNRIERWWMLSKLDKSQRKSVKRTMKQLRHIPKSQLAAAYRNLQSQRNESVTSEVASPCRVTSTIHDIKNGDSILPNKVQAAALESAAKLTVK